MLSNLLTAATLAALSAAAPLTNSNKAPVLARGIGAPTPANIPLPPAGQCAIVVLTNSDLPIGGQPTSASGEGIGPSAQGSRQVGVINTYGDTVGEYVLLNTDSPGFDAMVTLNDAIVQPEHSEKSVTMTADMVGPDVQNMGIKYSYNGIDYDCKGVCVHTDTGGKLEASTAVTGNFPC